MVSYQEAVTAAAGALRRGEEANWELAQLTYEATATGAGRRANSLGTKGITSVGMAQWCEDIRAASKGIRFSYQTGQQYKRIWAAFGHLGAAERPSWTEAYNALNPGATTERTYARHADSHIAQATPERKRELFFRLAHDEEIADTETIDRAATILAERQREVRGMPPVPAPLHPEHAEARAQEDSFGFSAAIDPLRLAVYLLDAQAAAHGYVDALRRAGGLSDDTRLAHLEDIDRVLEAWSGVRALVVGGVVIDEVEAFLATARTAV